MHRKIVLVKVESSVIEISESAIFFFIVPDTVTLLVFKRLKWNFIEIPTKQHPVNIRYPKKLVQHIVLESK